MAYARPVLGHAFVYCDNGELVPKSDGALKPGFQLYDPVEDKAQLTKQLLKSSREASSTLAAVVGVNAEGSYDGISGSINVEVSKLITQNTRSSALTYSITSSRHVSNGIAEDVELSTEAYRLLAKQGPDAFCDR